MGLLRDIIRLITKPFVNNVKGKVGESKVNAELNPWLFGKVEHRQINNLILLDENGKSHQIDHVEIRHTGIFCIETKNYKGYIYGNEYSDKWTQSLYGGNKYQFTNPLKQNKSHIYHLSNVLENKYRINSVVVMVQNNARRLYISNVVNLNYLKKYLDNFDDGTFLTTEEMDEIYNKLLSAQTDMSNREHVKNIRQTQDELKEGICPRCGGMLVERNGKYGRFYGCSNYPKCKFKTNDL